MSFNEQKFFSVIGSPERQNQLEIYVYFYGKRLLNKEMAHVIMEDNKSQDLQGELVSWRSRRDRGIDLL